MIETKDLLLDKGRIADWKVMYENVWKNEGTARYYDSKDIMFIKPSKIEVNPIDAATPLNHIGSEAFFVYVCC